MAPGANPSNLITSLGIPTRDRPDLLGRALSSYVENAARFDRSFHYAIMDDSREIAGQVQNRAHLKVLKRRFGVPIHYATRDQRALFADAVAARAGVPKDLARFALLGDGVSAATYGATRNALLLDSVGEVTVQADDDTVCHISASPGRKEGLALTTRTDANELWFFGSREDAIGAGPRVDIEMAAIHEQLLGKRPAVCVAASEASGQELDMATTESLLIDSIKASKARVAVSFMGIRGDAGAPYPFRFLHGGSTVDRLLLSEQAYQVAMTTRHVIRAASRLSISNGPFCMTTNIGLDHRSLLPPFMPVLRNEDGVFGCLLSVCFPNAFKGYSPYTVVHSPSETREAISASPQSRYTTFLCNSFLAWIIMSVDDHSFGRDAAQNLRLLGACLRKLGTLSQRDFSDFMQTLTRRVMKVNVAHAEQELAERPEAPTYWKDDVVAYLNVLKKAVAHPEFAVPKDLAGNPAERIARFRALVNQYGVLLIHWPDICEAALALRDKGRRLATAV